MGLAGWDIVGEVGVGDALYHKPSQEWTLGWPAAPLSHTTLPNFLQQIEPWGSVEDRKRTPLRLRTLEKVQK